MPLLANWEFPWARSPEVGTFVTRDRRLVCSGWAVADGAIPTIDIYVDGGLFERVTPSHYREDIEIAEGRTYPGASGPTGWAIALDASTWRPGPHELRLVARTDRAELPLGSRTVDLPDARPDLEAFWNDLLPILREPASARRHGHQAFLSSEPGAWRRHSTSVWGFSRFACELLTQGTGRVLAIGAGISPTVANLIQLDIVDYPNIDVISESAELPFRDEAFDAVICENVIEHVPDPFALVKEMDRVLKPGGQIGVNGTNLHFTHGYPSHYFNATEFGMRHLLETRSRFEGEYEFNPVPESLQTVLAYYVASLDPAARARVEGLTVRELLLPSHETRGLIANVHDLARRAISTNIYFKGRKKI